MTVLKLGSRKSALAQAQANGVADRLRRAFPELRVELVLMTTTGDEEAPLRKNGEGKGGLKALFTKEIEDALLENRIDLAVHSMKDLAAEIPKGLVIGAVPEREDPRDVWISRNKTSFQNLASGAKVGTGAIRRQAQLRHVRADLDILPVRGNVDTRLKKLAGGELEGIVLALAGLKRLGREQEATEIFPTDFMLPAVGQGCLAIEICQSNKAVLNFVKALDHAPSHQAALTERAFLKALSGTCQTPIAGLASHEGGQIILKGLVISPDGLQVIKGKESGRPFDAAGVGERLAAKLLAGGADKILHL